jgi:hypothetical protein
MRDVLDYMEDDPEERLGDVRWDDESYEDDVLETHGATCDGTHPLANDNRCGCSVCVQRVYQRPPLLCASEGPGVRCRRVPGHAGPRCSAFVGDDLVEWDTPPEYL